MGPGATQFLARKAERVSLRRCDQIGEFLARIEHARLHRGFADANNIGDLLDGLAVVIDEIDDLAMLRL